MLLLPSLLMYDSYARTRAWCVHQVSFEAVAAERPAFDVARLFLATLQLANNGNLALHHEPVTKSLSGFSPLKKKRSCDGTDVSVTPPAAADSSALRARPRPRALLLDARRQSRP